MRGKEKSKKVKYPKKSKKKKEEKLTKRRITKGIQKQIDYAKLLNGILIYKHTEIIPIHDEEELRKVRIRLRNIKNKFEIGNRTNFIIIDSQSGIDKSLLSNESWLLKQLDLGERIKEFLKTGDPNLAVETIKNYPEIIFYDSEDIELSLLLRLGYEEYEKLKRELYEKPKPFAIPLRNPFRQQIIYWEFLNKWGDKEEKRESARRLKDSKIEGFVRDIVGGGRPKGSVEYPINLKQARETYNTILKDIQKLYKNIDKKFQADRYNVLSKYIEEKKLVEIIAPAMVLANSDLNEGDLYETKKNKIAFNLSNIHPPQARLIALHITAYVYSIKPSYMHDKLFK